MFSQIGLGQGMTVDTITRPTEVVMSRNMSAGAQAKCTDIVAGGLPNYDRMISLKCSLLLFLPV
jgi:hypothetical protein